MVLASGTTYSPASQVFQVCNDSHTVQYDFTSWAQTSTNTMWGPRPGQWKHVSLFSMWQQEGQTLWSSGDGGEYHKVLGVTYRNSESPDGRTEKRNCLTLKRKFSEDDPLIMRVRIMYQLKDNDCSSGSLWFGFNGPMCLFFLLEDRHWISSTFWRQTVKRDTGQW